MFSVGVQSLLLCSLSYQQSNYNKLLKCKILPADPNVHALLWMAEAAIDMVGIALGFEGTKNAVNYFFVSGGSSQKRKSS